MSRSWVRRTSGVALVASALAATAPLGAESETSALDALKAKAPAVAERLDPASRAILSRVSTDELEALQEGRITGGDIRLANGATLAEFVAAVFGGSGYAIPFSTIDAGGGVSSAATLTLMGSIGQPDAALAENGTDGFLLVGGFRGRGAFAPGVLFRDGFETGDTTRWSETEP